MLRRTHQRARPTPGRLPEDEDLLYEEELLRNPFSLKMWWRYLEARKEAPARRRYLLFERALKALPGSYKVRARCRCQGPPARAACLRSTQPLIARRGAAARAGTRPALPRPAHPRSCGTPTSRSGAWRCGGWPSATPGWRR